jgi:hypothetical protein
VPIFMDRHDLRGLKADDVAEAHRRDVDIQDQHGVKYMAYWFDENNGAAFCLVHAPDPATAERVHREAHGEIPNAIIPVDPAAVEAFLGRIGDPRATLGAAAPAVGRRAAGRHVYRHCRFDRDDSASGGQRGARTRAGA